MPILVVPAGQNKINKKHCVKNNGFGLLGITIIQCNNIFASG